MKANELRIGNNAYLKLETVSDTVVLISVTDLLMLEQGKDHLLPIPITTEWLEKMGFTDGRIMFKRKGYDFGWSIHYDKGDFYTGNFEFLGPFQIKHVHQLQNIYFALTGEELQ